MGDAPRGLLPLGLRRSQFAAWRTRENPSHFPSRLQGNDSRSNRQINKISMRSFLTPAGVRNRVPEGPGAPKASAFRGSLISFEETHMLSKLKEFFRGTSKPRRQQVSDRDLLAATLETALLVDDQKLPTGVQWRRHKNDFVAECHKCHAHAVFANGVEKDRKTLVFEHCHGKRRDVAPKRLPVAKPEPRVPLSF